MVKKEQTRTCIVTRKAGTKDELIRFVLGPEQEVVADIRGKLPGRGVWVTNSRQAVEKAVAKNLFSAGFKQKVTVSAEISKNVENMLIDAIEQGLSMAKKSGLVITGFSKVDAAARRGDIEVLVHASDGREDGLAKVNSALKAGQWLLSEEGDDIKMPRVFNRLSSARLDKALGTSNAVHVALIKGGVTRGLKKQIEKLDNYCL